MKSARLEFMGAMFIFGSIGLVVRYLPFASSQIAFFRGIIGSLFMAAVLFRKRGRLSWDNIRPNAKMLGISGAAVGLNWILLFESYRYTSITNATICYYIAPLIATLLAWLLLKERLTRRSGVCLLLAVLGMCLVVSAGNSTGEKGSVLGIAFGLAAGVVYGCIMIVNRKLQGVEGMESSVVQLMAAAVVILPYMLLTSSLPEKVSAGSIGLLMVAGIVHTGIAYALYFGSIQRLQVQTSACLSYLDPVFAIVLSAAVLREPVSFWQLAGGILVLGASFFNTKWE